MVNEKLGCLAFILGFVAPRKLENPDDSSAIVMNEGDAHSGPGGYEGMGYSGGYADEYFTNSQNVHE